MTLDKIETPFERRRVIKYGRDGNKVVHRWYNVRHVIGTLYMSEITEDDYRKKIFDLFVFFPDVKYGLYYSRMANPDWYTPEKLLESLAQMGFEGKDTFVTDLDERMERNIHIGNAMIEFVRQWDSEKADVCAEYRAARLARREEEEHQRRMEEDAAEAKEKAENEAKLKAEKKQYLGWADSMSPMRFGKVDAVLGSLIRCDGKVMTRREFVVQAVKDGWMPKQLDGVTSWYGSKWEPKQSKPRTEYRLVKENLSYKVSKTEFEFAMYLVEHREVWN